MTVEEGEENDVNDNNLFSILRQRHRQDQGHHRQGGTIGGPPLLATSDDWDSPPPSPPVPSFHSHYGSTSHRRTRRWSLPELPPSSPRMSLTDSTENHYSENRGDVIDDVDDVDDEDRNFHHIIVAAASTIASDPIAHSGKTSAIADEEGGGGGGGGEEGGDVARRGRHEDSNVDFAASITTTTTTTDAIMTSSRGLVVVDDDDEIRPSPIDRLLRMTVVSDVIRRYHPLLDALLRNPRYALPVYPLSYIVLSILWTPLYYLSCLITEIGVYVLFLVVIAHGGRCLLRLLAFPGTNVRVYGEIENEFSRYSCKAIEGAASAIENLANAALRSANTYTSHLDDDDDDDRGGGDGDDRDDGEGDDDVDDADGGLSAALMRARAYGDRVLGTYAEVLHCLLMMDGRGGTVTKSRDDDHDDENGFYCRGGCVHAPPSRGGGACKRALFCRERGTIASTGSLPSSRAVGEEEEVDGDDEDGRGRGDVQRRRLRRGDHRLTRHGNNPLVGDVGNLGNLTEDARSDGRELLGILESTLTDLSDLIYTASGPTRSVSGHRGGRRNDHTDDDGTAPGRRSTTIGKEVSEVASRAIDRASELRDFVSRMRTKAGEDGDNNDGGRRDGGGGEESDDVGAETVRHRLEGEGGSAASAAALTSSSSPSSASGMIWSAARAIIGMIDPPPHKSIFGLDVLRGCFLARYRGARQFWVDRVGDGGSGARRWWWGGGGRLDVIVIPSSSNGRDDGGGRDNSVERFLPLSPRKGRGEDIGNGKNVGRKRKAVLYCNPNAGLLEVATGMGLTGGNVDDDIDDDDKNEPTFLAFKPSSQSLKFDAAIVARHIVDVVGVDELIIHGESIGGMAAAGAAKALTATSSRLNVSTILVCDRTFCNLEAVAQRLLGRWTGNAIRLLTPGWSTDVARDFLAARCPKIVAQDSADEIIHDYSSLKSGLAFAGELTKGHTRKVGWIMSPLIEHKIADLDNVGRISLQLASDE
ncbi:hypothetical protein ACHAXA_009376 [Cyclostephanos tholiformis]|uniref:AB hydrolase-1 domain-containing protein n=1 Tax=Cyclostephanos tholiformis TaxID=382380 RepID=A0ABD3RGD9_9STRA